jgi:hypothetical protein
MRVKKYFVLVIQDIGCASAQMNLYRLAIIGSHPNDAYPCSIYLFSQEKTSGHYQEKKFSAS